MTDATIYKIAAFNQMFRHLQAIYMSSTLAQQLIHDLSADFRHFSILLLPAGIVAVFFIAGAKLMEIKGYQKWPAIFAVLPVFWIILAGFDPRPERSRTTTLKLAVVFGSLNTLVLTLGYLYL